MKTAHYKIVFLILCLTGIMLAQDIKQNGYTNNNIIPGAVDQILNGLGKNTLSTFTGNQANLEQVGNFNQAVITQSKGSVINPNIAWIMQSSNNNSAEINQSGIGNNNSITQNGNNNEAVINVTGDNNNSTIDQKGNYNTLVQSINASNRNYIITQNGNNNSIAKYDTWESSKAYIISQTGNGMRIIISSNNYVK